MDDAQLDAMLNFLTPDMMRMSANMAQQNPEMLRQQMGGAGNQRVPAAAQAPIQPQAGQIDSTQAQQPLAGMPAGMPGGMPNMEDAMKMMNDPNMKNLMSNPEMMKLASQMMQGQQNG